MKAIHGEHDAKNTKYNDYPAKSGRAILIIQASNHFSFKFSKAITEFHINTLRKNARPVTSD